MDIPVETTIGRFGLKANTSSLLTQVATAYQQDMGITSYVHPDENSLGQHNGPQQQIPANLNLPDSMLNATTFYVRTLAVPARRNVNDPDVQAGSILFNQINCSGCHRPTVMTGPDFTVPQLSGQRIHPYTDLLVHDMGDGLADNRPDFLATGREWRTQPSGAWVFCSEPPALHFYLHDGRARTIEEAILWHDGEAAKSKQAFTAIIARTKEHQLMKFLNSL